MPPVVSGKKLSLLLSPLGENTFGIEISGSGITGFTVTESGVITMLSQHHAVGKMGRSYSTVSRG